MNPYIIPGCSILACVVAAALATRLPGPAFFLIGLVLGYWVFRGLIK